MEMPLPGNKNVPIKIYFRVCFKTYLGENIKIIGQNQELGHWSAQHALEMTTNQQEYPMWFNP